VAGGDEALFAALKVREFHEETIRKYKDEGALGEGSNGLLVYMRADKYESDKGQRERLLKIIEEENRARRVLWTRSLVAAGAAKPDEKELMALASRFAEEQRALAARNDWIQDNSGRWVRKK
jgi:hypothetical protein